MSERYNILKRIGQGGLGAVYAAHDTMLDREVAIKRVLLESGENIQQLEVNLIKEAKTLSALQHPNIVTVFDVGKDDEGPFLVMEYLKGENLEDTIARAALMFDDFREVVIQSLEGMIAAGSVGLVHRDMKPANIMVIWLPSGKFQIKVLDFWAGQVFPASPSLQTIDHGDSILGSIYFMAPEQFERQPLDVRTDLYSLGCIYYYTLTTQYPFTGDNAPQVMAAHLQHRFTPLHQLRPDVPEWACRWVEWLMEREIQNRPADAHVALDFFRSGRFGPPQAQGQSQAAAGERRPGPGGNVSQPMNRPGQGAQSQRMGQPPRANTGSPPQQRPGGATGPRQTVTAEHPHHPVMAGPAEPRPFPWKMVIVILVSLITLTAIGVWGASRMARNSAIDLVNESPAEGDAETVRRLIPALAYPPKADEAISVLGNLRGNQDIPDTLASEFASRGDKVIQRGLMRAMAKRKSEERFSGAQEHINRLLPFLQAKETVNDAADVLGRLTGGPELDKSLSDSLNQEKSEIALGGLLKAMSKRKASIPMAVVLPLLKSNTLKEAAWEAAVNAEEKDIPALLQAFEQEKNGQVLAKAKESLKVVGNRSNKGNTAKLLNDTAAKIPDPGKRMLTENCPGV